eukprot:CAMPEP_0118933566 /NCGR_PEP_ID=MMETSP1169-20130426/12061_1 /TAXON_ID=36882 /ORGANISM="Pyramimonas obovata, Strain CCMP722" /LENGTH=247 /DNA_ID=CAMNT_0006876347 /DNA_START=145 /DNA_END=885 /DNA_ORIENTATION=-
MGAAQSSEGEGEGPRVECPSSQEYEYIAGTNLPVGGWLQPCTSCATTTARTVTNEDMECVFMCRRCSHVVGLTSTQDERRWEVAAGSSSPFDEETTTSGNCVEDYITYNNDDVDLEIMETHDEDYDSHIESVDILCRVVVGEMLIDSPHESAVPISEDKQTGKETPRGVVDGADVWSDLDNNSDGDSAGDSPRSGKSKDKRAQLPPTAASKTSASERAAGKVGAKGQKGSWLFSLADTLYPHDIFRW